MLSDAEYRPICSLLSIQDAAVRQQCVPLSVFFTSTSAVILTLRLVACSPFTHGVPARSGVPNTLLDSWTHCLLMRSRGVGKGPVSLEFDNVSFGNPADKVSLASLEKVPVRAGSRFKPSSQDSRVF